MTKNINPAIALLLCAVTLPAPARASAQVPQAASAIGLRIVVISGEDAVNIIQQKTAVNPIVEVRDRNNLPVSGVAVTFNIGGGGGASFAGGASTLTVTTNAAGQAVVTGLTPTTAGAVSINATAVVNGQTIAATITQTNFATAAEAAQAGASAGASGSGGGASGGGTSGAAGGGGGGIGGMSGLTLGLVGGGIAAAGAVVATQAGGGGSPPAAATGTTGNTGTGTGTAGTPTTPAPPAAPPAPAAPTSQTFNGPFSGLVTFTWTTSADGTVIQTCNATYTRSGTLRIILETRSDGTAGGTGQLLGVSTRINSGTCNDGTFIPLTGIVDETATDSVLVPITGTPANLRYTENISLNDSADGVTVNITGTSAFAGSLSAGVITGTLTETFQMTGGGSGVSLRGNWSSTIPVTLR